MSELEKNLLSKKSELDAERKSIEAEKEATTASSSALSEAEAEELAVLRRAVSDFKSVEEALNALGAKKDECFNLEAELEQNEAELEKRKQRFDEASKSQRDLEEMLAKAQLDAENRMRLLEEGKAQLERDEKGLQEAVNQFKENEKKLASDLEKMSTEVVQFTAPTVTVDNSGETGRLEEELERQRTKVSELEESLQEKLATIDRLVVRIEELDAALTAERENSQSSMDGEDVLRKQLKDYELQIKEVMDLRGGLEERENLLRTKEEDLEARTQKIEEHLSREVREG